MSKPDDENQHVNDDNFDVPRGTGILSRLAVPAGAATPLRVEPFKVGPNYSTRIDDSPNVASVT
jgi:hypothetical protein